MDVLAGAYTSNDAYSLTLQAVNSGADAVFSMLPFPRALLAGVAGAGRRAPQDVIVVGRPEGTVEAQTEPPLSVLSMQGVQTAHVILTATRRVMEGERGIIGILPHQLVVRESSLRF